MVFTVKIDRWSPRRPAFTAINLNFHISAHLFANGSQSDDFDLYTLNYIISSEFRQRTSFVDFGWNWNDVYRKNDLDGFMAVRLKENCCPSSASCARS